MFGVLSFIITCAVFYFTLTGIQKLLSFLKNAHNGKPFVKENGENLLYVAKVLIFLSLVIVVCVGSMDRYNTLPGDFSFLLKSMHYIVPVVCGIIVEPFFILGVFVFSLGRIIIHGAEIKEENDLTV